MREILIKMKGVLKIESEKRKVVISEDQMMLHDFPFGQKIDLLQELLDIMIPDHLARLQARSFHLLHSKDWNKLYDVRPQI